MIFDLLPAHGVLDQLLVTPLPPYDITPVLLTGNYHEPSRRVKNLRKSISDVEIALRDINSLETKSQNFVDWSSFARLHSNKPWLDLRAPY